MKKYFLFIIVAATCVGCDVKRKDKISDDSKLGVINDSLKQAKEQQARDEAMKNTTTVQLIDSAFDFGTIAQGEKVEYNYRFKNTGTNPLIIFKAEATCGCTIPEKPEKPLMPGETGVIKVVFNSAGKKDHQSKDITVTANTTPEFPILKLTGTVKEK
ncbi:DUF1573 domain-containing protein [Ferruginibacter sp.]|nr:DUF1573 domain-containing protein [Ferruginibacter sp.]